MFNSDSPMPPLSLAWLPWALTYLQLPVHTPEANAPSSGTSLWSTHRQTSLGNYETLLPKHNSYIPIEGVVHPCPIYNHRCWDDPDLSLENRCETEALEGFIVYQLQTRQCWVDPLIRPIAHSEFPLLGMGAGVLMSVGDLPLPSPVLLMAWAGDDVDEEIVAANLWLTGYDYAWVWQYHHHVGLFSHHWVMIDDRGKARFTRRAASMEATRLYRLTHQEELMSPTLPECESCPYTSTCHPTSR